MFSATQNRASLYVATDYVVRGATILIGSRSRAVDRLLARHHARTGVFLTACNPQGRASGTMTNARRAARLAARARARGWRFIAGMGIGRDPGWPPEPSLLVVRMPDRRAAAVGRSLRQNALVAVARGQPARLMGLR